jgi:hypothetical protein
MTTNIKSFIGSLAFMAILFTVACTKDTVEELVTTDANLVAVNELVTTSDLVIKTSGALDVPTSGPDSPDSARTGHGHGWGRGHGSHPGGIAGDSIGFGTLPTATQTYLLTNADTSKIKKIVKITLQDGTFQYVVRFTDGTHSHFDATGTFISTTTDRHVHVVILFTDLPTAAQTYLNANTTAANIVAVIKVTNTNGIVTYGVRLVDNTRITFNAAGEVIPNPTGGRRGHR